MNLLNRSYYPALDGLRGIAILLVICRHNFNFIPNFELGWVGVDLFFVLSGFLITDILLRARDSRNFLQHFYIRRILRIFPLYYGVVLLFFVIAPFLQNLHDQYSYYHSNQGATWFHLQNWLYIFHEKPNDFLLMNHFWSLSVEEQFYLVWPFVILAVKNMRRLSYIAYMILAACIIGRIASWAYFGNGYTNFYFQYMTRIDGLCIGSLIAIWRLNPLANASKNLYRLAGILLGSHLVLLILAKTIFLQLPHFQFLGYSSTAAVFSIVVFLAIEKSNKASKLLLENRFLRNTGRISYGLYVYHWPVLMLAKLYFLDAIVSLGVSYYPALVLVSTSALIIAVIISILSYRYFETRFLAMKDRIPEEGIFTHLRRKLGLLLRPAVK